MITCAVCGREIAIERSRLFWSASGTFRTCQNVVACRKRAANRKP